MAVTDATKNRSGVSAFIVDRGTPAFPTGGESKNWGSVLRTPLR